MTLPELPGEGETGGISPLTQFRLANSNQIVSLSSRVRHPLLGVGVVTTLAEGECPEVIIHFDREDRDVLMLVETARRRLELL